jgi:endonuclease/exonuclease/phosphatase family metal-dependent hydrolase
MLQRHGGCWTAASTSTRLSLVKALGTYLCWTRLTSGTKQVQILNCYLQPGEDAHLKERAKRVTDIVRDILRQDASAAVVVCGDFNNHMTFVSKELTKCGFTAALDKETSTHTLGGHLDQLFAKNVDITNALVNDGFDKEITDHKCLKVSLTF